MINLITYLTIEGLAYWHGTLPQLMQVEPRAIVLRTSPITPDIYE